MSRPPYVFLSYKHEPNTTGVTGRFHDQLAIYRKGLGLDGIFMDKQKIQGGALWRDEVEAALERATHFVAMLTTAYWRSDECHRELAHAVARFQREGSAGMRLLFVQVHTLAPELLFFDQPAEDANVAFMNAELKKAKLEKVSDLQFLGPFDIHARLIRLPPETDPTLDDVLHQLVLRLRDTLPPRN